jgi:hypothetical protein
LFGKIEKLEQKTASRPFADPNGCKQYVDVSREKLNTRIAEERVPK